LLQSQKRSEEPRYGTKLLVVHLTLQGAFEAVWVMREKIARIGRLHGKIRVMAQVLQQRKRTVLSFLR